MCQVQTKIQEGNGWLYQVRWEEHRRRESVGKKGRGHLGWISGGQKGVYSRQQEQLEQGQQLGAGGWMWTWQLRCMRQLRLL